VAAKQGKGKKVSLGPSTIVKPCLLGAAALFVIQAALHSFLGV
jgi:hypothetical protein